MSSPQEHHSNKKRGAKSSITLPRSPPMIPPHRPTPPHTHCTHRTRSHPPSFTPKRTRTPKSPHHHHAQQTGGKDITHTHTIFTSKDVSRKHCHCIAIYSPSPPCPRPSTSTPPRLPLPVLKPIPTPPTLVFRAAASENAPEAAGDRVRDAEVVEKPLVRVSSTLR